MSLFINSKNLLRSTLLLFLPLFTLSLAGLLVTSQPQTDAQFYSEGDCSLKINEDKCKRAIKVCDGSTPDAKENCINAIAKRYKPVYEVCRDKDDPQACHKTVKEACKNRTTTSSRDRCKSEAASDLTKAKATAQVNEKFTFGEKPKTNGTCGEGDDAVDTRFDFGCQGVGTPIEDLAYSLIRFLSIGVGLVMVASIIYAGIQYSSSEGSPEATVAAKKRIQNAIIGLVFYLFIFAFVQYLVPGGLFVP